MSGRDYQGFVSVLGSSLAVSSGISSLFSSGDNEQTASCDLFAQGQSHQIETIGSASLTLMEVELDMLSEMDGGRFIERRCRLVVIYSNFDEGCDFSAFKLCVQVELSNTNIALLLMFVLL